MVFRRCHPLRALFTPAVAALISFTAACADDDATAESDSTEGSSTWTTSTTSTSTTDASDAGTSETATTTDTTTGTTTSTTGDTDSGTDTEGSTGSTGGAEIPELGATPNVLCEASTLLLQTIIDENASGTPDAAVITEAYLGADQSGTALQDFVQFYGAWLGRIEDATLIDDQAILASLSGNPTDEDLIDVETRVLWVMSLMLRQRIGEVADALPDVDRDPAILYAQWDDAYCYWDATLRAYAQEADAEGIDIFLSAQEEIDAGFERGHQGIEGPQPWAPDEFEVPPAKQMVEKSTFRVWDRLVDKYAALADQDNDSLAARRAYGLFQVVEDRFEGKNTCGVETIETLLTGPVAGIDAAVIEQELGITWAKRTRRYTSHALDDETVGTAEGYKGAIEGGTYVKTMLYDMAVTPGDHMQIWDDWTTAIRDDDFAAAQAASATLTADVCAYHTALGLPDCTTDDVGPCP